MRDHIFRKGEAMKDKVVLVGRAATQNRLYFEVQENDCPSVTVASDGRKTFIESCTCKHCSVHDGKAQRAEFKLALCSYKIAVIKHLGRSS